MSEVHRYQVVTMLSMAGATIGYDPHGPDVVMASAFDDATRLFLDAAERCVAAERREKELQQRLTAADERVDQAVIALNEIARVSRMGEKPFEIATLAIGEMSAGIEQPAPVAVVLPKRSNQDYAIEHAEYMAQSADDVLAKFQAYGLALLAVDEGGDDGEGELFENIDSARGDLQESLVELRGMVYEFRKRSARLNAKPR